MTQFTVRLVERSEAQRPTRSLEFDLARFAGLR